MRQNFFSIIIPVRQENDYLKETLKKLQKQKHQNYEILVITDKISKNSNPAYKRNLGAKMAKGNYLAFLDDDSYPHPNWLKNAQKQLQKDPKLAGLCGPCLTPPKDSLLQKASGLVWSSYLGAGGAGTYRNRISPKRYVQDFPSVNLIVNKKDFFAVKGFDTHHWPGEDTILCLNLTQKLNKKILYHPSIQVFHHRRPVIKKHLQQITRYAIHRGHFAKIYPQTSFKIGYLLPSLFSIYVIISSILNLFFFDPKLPFMFINFPLLVYSILLLLTLLDFLLIRKAHFLTSLTAVVSIPLTHLYYGVLFIYGFFKKELAFSAHQVDTKTGSYLGG